MAADVYAVIDPNRVIQSFVMWDGVDQPDQFAPNTMQLVGKDYGETMKEGDTLNADGTVVSAPLSLQEQNRDALQGKVGPAIQRLRQIQNQTNAFQGQAPYTTANLAALNDLLSKVQSLAGAVNDIASIQVTLIRRMNHQ